MLKAPCGPHYIPLGEGGCGNDSERDALFNNLLWMVYSI